MEEERLRPGVEYGYRARCRSEASPTDGMKSSDHRLEQEGVACPPVGQEEKVQGGGYREDQVKVRDWEKVVLSCLDPARLFEALTLGAMPVPAGVVEGFLATAAVAHL